MECGKLVRPIHIVRNASLGLGSMHSDGLWSTKAYAEDLLVFKVPHDPLLCVLNGSPTELNRT